MQIIRSDWVFSDRMTRKSKINMRGMVSIPAAVPVHPARRVRSRPPLLCQGVRHIQELFPTNIFKDLSEPLYWPKKRESVILSAKFCKKHCKSYCLLPTPAQAYGIVAVCYILYSRLFPWVNI